MRITGQLLRSRSKRPLHVVRYIDLSSCNIVTLDHLGLCPKLTTLVARNNLLESIPNLDCCPQLWKVDLAHNKLRCLNGFSRFSVLGSLVLSNNCLDWNHLEKLCDIHILELSLHGNPKLEKEPYYRIHVIDSLPLLWMLDGRLITSAERRQVYRFFKESELTDRPVRHKLSKKRFTPTSLKNLPVNGVFGEKTEHWMKRFPLHEKISKELDRRRLQYLAYNLKGNVNVQLQTTYVAGGENDVCEGIFVEVVTQRDSDKEKSNMLLLLLVANLEFRIPGDVIKQTLEITKLNKIGSFNTKEMFSLPRKHQCSLASLLLAGVKIDRDANIIDGLYDSLYLSLHDLVSEWHKYSNGDNITRESGGRDVLAAEVVQLFCLVPAFLMLLGKDAGLLDLVSSATRDPEIGEHLRDILWKEEVKGGNVGNIFQELGRYILKKVHTRWSYSGKSGRNTSRRLERTHSPLRTSSYTRTDESPKRAQSAFYTAHQNTRTVKSTAEDENKKPGRTTSPRKSGRSAVKRIALGDKVITGDQVSGNIVALPDKGIALVQQDIIPGRGYPHLNLVKQRYVDNYYTYVDTQMLEWHHQGFWIVKELKHDLRDDEVQTQAGNSENNSETFVTRTVRKQLPLEVWMSFSTENSTTENSTAKPETDASESSGTVITEHVRELVKECIREAKETNEIIEQPEVQLEPIEKHNIQLIETESTLNNFEDAIQNKNERRSREQDYDKEEYGWVDLVPDEDMISKTENDRLDAWRLFRLRGLEERSITDKNGRSSPLSPEQNHFIAPRTGKHECVLPKEVYTTSGKRLSFPLPGWMEELHLRNHRRSHSSSSRSPRKHHDLEIKENWTPIIFPAPVARSVGFPPPHMTGESNNGNVRDTRKRWPKRHQSAQAILKRK